MISIASIDDLGVGLVSDQVCEVTVYETSTQANTLIERLQHQTALDDEFNNMYRGGNFKSPKDSQQLLFKVVSIIQ